MAARFGISKAAFRTAFRVASCALAETVRQQTAVQLQWAVVFFCAVFGRDSLTGFEAAELVLSGCGIVFAFSAASVDTAICVAGADGFVNLIF